MTLDRIDNTLGYSPENCRWATLSDQQSNQRKRKGCSSKFIGVSMRPSGRWTATITKNGKTKYLGDYDTEEEASHAYQNAKLGVAVKIPKKRKHIGVIHV